MRESLFVLDQNRANDAGIVGSPDVWDQIGNDVHFAMGIGQCKDRLSHRVKRKLFVSAFRKVFDGVCQKLQLID